MIAKYYGRSYTLQYLRGKSFITRAGVSLLGISDAAESIGFKTVGVKLGFETLISEVSLPCIAHWKQNHFVVVYDIKTNVRSKKIKIFVADPAHGLITYTKEEFLKGWISHRSDNED